MPVASTCPPATLICGRYRWTLERPLLMGVVNLTEDSFSDGGRLLDPERAVAQARELVAAGADIIDLGAESTRPGATAVDAALEIERLVPVLGALRDCGAALSVDTRKAEVMTAALAAGADMINDVNGFRDEGAIDAVRESAAGLCVMHMQGTPEIMQAAPSYRDAVGEVAQFLRGRAEVLEQAGVAPERIVLDPGIGFGKSLVHNLQLLARLEAIAAIGLPVLIGVSRKSMIGTITGRGVDARLTGSIAAMLFAVSRGASIVRVHDVAASRDALLVWQAIAEAGSSTAQIQQEG
ncbi:MAG: dihydropteroate synthase [Burkholderiaceae bacterium]|nr:dihydropteroate synthase [Burkholderiaceae bacterium]